MVHYQSGNAGANGMSERVAILGAGGIGGVIGGYLVRSGCPVTLIDLWSENVETIRKNGLTVTGCGIM